MWLGDGRSVEQVQGRYGTGGVKCLDTTRQSGSCDVSEYSSTHRRTCTAVICPFLGIYELSTTNNHRNTPRIISGSGESDEGIPRVTQFCDDDERSNSSAIVATLIFFA